VTNSPTLFLRGPLVCREYANEECHSSLPCNPECHNTNDCAENDGTRRGVEERNSGCPQEKAGHKVERQGQERRLTGDPRNARGQFDKRGSQTADTDESRHGLQTVGDRHYRGDPADPRGAGENVAGREWATIRKRVAQQRGCGDHRRNRDACMPRSNALDQIGGCQSTYQWDKLDPVCRLTNVSSESHSCVLN